jgi:ribosome biogenesis GTPase
MLCDMNKGLVYKTTGSWYEIREEETDKRWRGRIRGKLKIDKSISSTNPIAVGDTVLFEAEGEGEEERASIQSVSDRENYIVRVSPHNRHQKHIVAANLDLAVLVATLSSPRTSSGFIDRFLLTAEMYHIPAIIVLNKADELVNKTEEVDYFKAVYGKGGYEVLLTNSFDAETLKPLAEKLRDKTALLSGHSGVGKSTLINALLPGLELRTAQVSDYSGKGQHTTTFAEMFDVPAGGKIIDTPGVKEFGLIDVDKYELAHYFPEFREVMSGCRYNNCLHLEEPGCAVHEAVREGHLLADRYISYRTILEDLGNHQRR